MKRCNCCGQVIQGKPFRIRGKWTFLESLKAGDALTFDNAKDKERARYAARQKNIPCTTYKHEDGSGYSLVISS